MSCNVNLSARQNRTLVRLTCKCLFPEAWGQLGKYSLWCKYKIWCPRLGKARADLPGYCIKSSTAQKAWKSVFSSLCSVLGGFSSGSGHKTKNTTISTNWYLPWCLVRENEPFPAFLEAVTPGQGKKPVGMSHGSQGLPANGKSRIQPNSHCLRTTCFVQDVSPWVAKCLQGVSTCRQASVHSMGLEAICSFPFNQNLLLLCFLFCLVTEAKLHVPSRGS